MAIVIAIFTILICYDIVRFIRNKEKARVYILYLFFMAASLVVSLLLMADKLPFGPSQLIDEILKMIGVLK